MRNNLILVKAFGRAISISFSNDELGFLPARNSYCFAEAATLCNEMKVYCNLLAVIFKNFGLYIDPFYLIKL